MFIELMKPWRNHKKGAIIDVNENRARLLINYGDACPVETPKKEIPVETAEKKPSGEKAELPPVEKPKKKKKARTKK